MKPKTLVTYGAVFGVGALVAVGGLALGGVFEPNALTPAQTTGQVVVTPSAEGVINIGDITRNTPVFIRGVVEEVSDEDEFVLQDATGSVRVWTGATFFAVTPGEEISVRGFVDGDLLLEVYAQEIIRADGTVVVIGLRGEAATDAPPPTSDATSGVEVTNIGDITRNTPVFISGVVERVSDEDEFVLQDATGSVRVWTGATFFTVSLGEEVSVRGFVDDGLLLEVYAQEITRSDGTVLTIDLRDD
jgi:uncharacterized protein YdeI (BOF family)